MGASSIAILILLESFLLMVFLRFPTACAMALSSVFCLLFQEHSPTTICQQVVKGISPFSLMAVPFFITMGCLIGSGGISERLITLVDAYVGWVWNDIVIVNIVASYFFSGISSFAPADMAFLGSTLIPTMVDQGYDGGFSTTVIITPSCEELLMPPNRNMVIYATTAGNIFMGSLLLAGRISGTLLTVTPVIGSYIISVKRNYPRGERFSTINLVKQLSVSFRALAAVLIVVFGVVGGVFTVAESATVAVVHSLIVSVSTYKGLDWKGAWRVLGDSVDTLSTVMILIAASSIFEFYLTQLYMSALVASAITGMINSLILLALLLSLILPVPGCVMDIAPITLIATSILLPIVASTGLGLVQPDIMVVLSCGIGLLTSPVGAVPFIGSAVSKVPMGRVAKTTLPLYVCMIITLLLITFTPAVSMWLPSVLTY